MKAATVATSIIALAWAATGAAQVTPPTPTRPTGPQPSILQAPISGDGKASSQAEAIQQRPDEAPSANDIIVTAQKRSERLVDVPISITAISAADLAVAGSDSLLTLNKLVPGVYITRPVYFLSPTVRGVGSTLSVSQESNVAIYVDGVYQPTQSSNIFDLASISDIEVLKGPQGTLFGRNATGGAFLIKTLDPSDRLAGRFNVSYARFNDIKATGYVNLPIAPGVAVNGALSYHYGDGYIHDLRTGQNVDILRSLTARGKLSLEPTNALRIVLTAAHNDFDDPTGSNYQSLDGRSSYAALPGAMPIASDRFHTSHSFQDIVRTTGDEYNAHVSLDLGLGTLSSITALKRDYLTASNDVDNTYLPIFRVDFGFKTRTFTQEVNLTSPSHRPFSYVVGFYYFNEQAYYTFFKYNLVSYLFSDRRNSALAGYGDGTYQIGNLALIAGIRYSTEKRDQSNGLFVPVAVSRMIQARDSSWTPRFGLRYSLTDHANIYATYSKGFKSGAFDSTSLTNLGVVPETVDAYEFGFKMSSSAFTLSAATFYDDYQQIQSNALLITNNVALNTLVNAGSARIYGFEAEGTVKVTDQLNFRAAFGNTHGRYHSFLNAPGYIPLQNGGNAAVFQNVAGRPVVRSPDYTFSGTMNYRVPLGSKELEFSMQPAYTSRIYYDFLSTQSQGPVVTLDGSAALILSGGLKITAFGRNLTDRIYFVNRSQSTTGTTVTYATPRTYGVSFAYAF